MGPALGEQSSASGYGACRDTSRLGEAAARDIDMLSRYDPGQATGAGDVPGAHRADAGPDDLAEMLCKRVAANVQRARAELEEIRLR